MHHRNSSQIMNILCDLALKFNLNIIRFVKNEINNSKFLMQFFLHHKSNIKFTILCTYFCEISRNLMNSSKKVKSISFEAYLKNLPH